MSRLELTLYVAGMTARSARTIESLRRMLAEGTGGEYELTVCDVLKEPQTAEREKILATPTLVLTSPPPARQIVGDLAEPARVLPYLGITPGKG